jgi:hypothetical protein
MRVTLLMTLTGLAVLAPRLASQSYSPRGKPCPSSPTDSMANRECPAARQCRVSTFDSLPPWVNARRCAEEFVVRQGYTLLPGTTDSTLMASEFLGDPTPSLESTAAAALCDATECLVYFPLLNVRCLGRAVRMTTSYQHLYMTHEWHPLPIPRPVMANGHAPCRGWSAT